MISGRWNAKLVTFFGAFDIEILVGDRMDGNIVNAFGT